MAWLQNLAGRAEDLLNKIDQNAATVLSDTNNKLAEEEVATSSRSFQESISDPRSKDVDTSPVGTVELVKAGTDEDIHQKPSNSHSYVSDDGEKSWKEASPDSKSLSSHNSFIFEDVQNDNETISKYESEIQDLNGQLLNLQHLYAELRNENANLRSQIEASNYLVLTAQSEMEKYKARAQRIIQEKESLILLKHENKSDENSGDILTKYCDELKKEIEFQQNQNVELTEKNKKLTQEISLLQQQIVMTQNSSQQSAQILQESLMTEKKIRTIAEEECRVKNQELQLKIQELAQQHSIILSKNEEIDQLQEALKNKTNFEYNGDFEERIKSLTNTLMLKQNALETATTERNALKIQLEKLESDYQNTLAQLGRARVRVINMNDTDDAKSQAPQFMRVSPFDAGVTRRVKHAYSTLDAISVRTGKFLRRYPVARVCVFCYMILLQFWALIVVFIYTPNSNR